MYPRKLLTFANSAMATTFVAFCTAAYFAWFREGQFTVHFTAFLHLSQIVLAGLFKISYVLRLIAQKELGMELR